MDGMFTKLLQPIFIREGHRAHFEEVKHSQQKEVRIIDTLEPVLNQHRLVVPIGLIERDLRDVELEHTRPYSLFYQLTHLTKEKGSLRHDDRLDALAGAVAYWVEAMGRDDLVAHKDHLADAAHQSIEEFLKIVDHGFGDPLGTQGDHGFGHGYTSGGWLG